MSGVGVGIPDVGRTRPAPGPGAGTGRAIRRIVAGPVRSIDRARRRVELGGVTYAVASGVTLDLVEGVGVTAVVQHAGSAPSVVVQLRVNAAPQFLRLPG